MKKYKATITFELPFEKQATDKQCAGYIEHLMKQAQVSFREWYTNHMTQSHEAKDMKDKQVARTVAASCKQDESIMGKAIKTLKVEPVEDDDDAE